MAVKACSILGGAISEHQGEQKLQREFADKRISFDNGQAVFLAAVQSSPAQILPNIHRAAPYLGTPKYVAYYDLF